MSKLGPVYDKILSVLNKVLDWQKILKAQFYEADKRESGSFHSCLF